MKFFKIFPDLYRREETTQTFEELLSRLDTELNPNKYMKVRWLFGYKKCLFF